MLSLRVFERSMMKLRLLSSHFVLFSIFLSIVLFCMLERSGFSNLINLIPFGVVVCSCKDQKEGRMGNSSSLYTIGEAILNNFWIFF